MLDNFNTFVNKAKGVGSEVIDEDSGRVYTEGAPTTQPSGTDGMPGGYHPVSNPYGGMKEIDHWCPRYMHAKAKAIDRDDPTELFKANTSGQDAIDQSMASPMVDDDDDITSFLLPKDTFHETVWCADTLGAEGWGGAESII